MRSLDAMGTDIEVVERALYDREQQLSKHMVVLKQAWKEQAKPIAIVAVGAFGAGLWWRFTHRKKEPVPPPHVHGGMTAEQQKQEINAAAAPSRWAQLAALALPLVLHQVLPRVVPPKWRPLLMSPWLGMLFRWGRGRGVRR